MAPSLGPGLPPADSPWLTVAAAAVKGVAWPAGGSLAPGTRLAPGFRSCPVGPIYRSALGRLVAGADLASNDWTNLIGISDGTVLEVPDRSSLSVESTMKKRLVLALLLCLSGAAHAAYTPCVRAAAAPRNASAG